jgi:hypothetical protein
MNYHYNAILYNLSTFIGIIALWVLYDKVSLDKIKILSTLSGFTFLLFVAHSPLIVIYKKGLLYLYLPSLLVFFIAPIITIGTILIIASFIKTHWPKVYTIMAGGR